MITYSVNKKEKFIQDHKYVRHVLRDIEQLMAEGNNNTWEEIEECYLELSAVMATLEQYSKENYEHANK